MADIQSAVNDFLLTRGEIAEHDPEKLHKALMDEIQKYQIQPNEIGTFFQSLNRESFKRGAAADPGERAKMNIFVAHNDGTIGVNNANGKEIVHDIYRGGDGATKQQQQQGDHTQTGEITDKQTIQALQLARTSEQMFLDQLKVDNGKVSTMQVQDLERAENSWKQFEQGSEVTPQMKQAVDQRIQLLDQLRQEISQLIQSDNNQWNSGQFQQNIQTLQQQLNQNLESMWIK